MGAWPWPARCLLAPLAALTAGLACFQRQPHQTIEVGWASQASGAPIPLLRPGQRQRPAAAAAASGEPAPRGGGRAGAARSSSARRRSFPNSPSPRAPRASRASGGQLWHAMAMATRPRTLLPALGEGGERVGRAGWGSGGRAAGGRTSAGMCPRTCCIYPLGLGVALGCPASCSLHAPGPQQPSRACIPRLPRRGSSSVASFARARSVAGGPYAAELAYLEV